MSCSCFMTRSVFHVMFVLLLFAVSVSCDEQEGSGNHTTSPVADGTYPNYMVPVWKDKMIAHANNLTEDGISIFLDCMRTGYKYRLVAFQGCRIVGLLANFDRAKYGDEIRERVAKLGGIAATTMAMGSHMVSAKVQSMGCFAIQALADGHRKHTHEAINLGAVDVVTWVLKHHGSLDAEIAEYCSAAVASLAYDPLGASRLGQAGAVDAIIASMKAHLSKKPEIQIYSCAALQRLMGGDQRNLERVKQNKHAIFAIVDAIKTFNSHPTVVSICGG
mmetsp:Transcript_34965/g.109313  ORF Transcript_34965/g.109313 Transcript_34965/m.109313 type:complete len:276 (+) Transcript_34965:211-1038(+)